MRTLRIVGLGGSMAGVSRSRAALVLALEGATKAGAEAELLDISGAGPADLQPGYGPTDDGRHKAHRVMLCCGRDALEQPDVPGNDIWRFQERARLAASLGGSEPTVPPRQSHRAHQRRRGNPGPPGDQHDG